MYKYFFVSNYLNIFLYVTTDGEMMEAGRHGDQGCVATADLNSEFESFYNVIPGHQLEGKKLTQLTSV